MTRAEWQKKRLDVIAAQNGKCHACAWGWPSVKRLDVVRDKHGVLRAYCLCCRRRLDGKARAIKAQRTKRWREDHPQLALPRV